MPSRPRAAGASWNQASGNNFVRKQFSNLTITQTMPNHHSTIAATAMALAISVVSSPAQNPVPIPDGFDFPAPQADLELLRNNKDMPGMRKHAWRVFAGMTQPTPGGEAIWETWWPSGVVMDPAANLQGVGAPRGIKQFRQPRQFGGARGEAVPQAVGASLAEFVLLAMRHGSTSAARNFTSRIRSPTSMPSGPPERR